MIRTTALLSVLALSTTALAVEPGESNDETVVFEGEERLFKGVEQAYGLDLWNEGVGIYAKADTTSDLTFIMEGVSHLEWPDILENSWDDDRDGKNGQISLRNKAAVWIEITGEIFGVRLGYEIWREEIEWEDTFDLRSFLLEGTPGGKTATLSARGDDIVAFEEDFDVIEDTLNIQVGGSVRPILQATVTGHAVEVEDGSVASTQGTMLVEAPDVNEGEVEFDAVWVGDVAAEVGLEVVPTVTVKVGNLSVGPLQYPLAIDIFKDTVPLVSEDSRVVHDLPAVVPSARTLDFGQVTIGEKSTQTFTLQNIGNVELEGEATIEGDGFVMSDTVILVQRDNEGAPFDQQLEIDFLPTAEGAFSGTLVLSTNDPVQPEVRIPMAGAGVQPATDPGDGNGDPNNPGDGDVVTQPTSGCGCSTTSPVTGFGGMFVLGLVGLIARRRS